TPLASDFSYDGDYHFRFVANGPRCGRQIGGVDPAGRDNRGRPRDGNVLDIADYSATLSGHRRRSSVLRLFHSSHLPGGFRRTARGSRSEIWLRVLTTEISRTQRRPAFSLCVLRPCAPNPH